MSHRLVTFRPPVMQAARLVELNDADLARLLGLSKMAVSDWSRGVRPIPRVRHGALIMLLLHLHGDVGVGALPPLHNAYAKRARLLDEVLMTFIYAAADEMGQLTDAEADAAEAMAREMIERLRAGGEKPGPARSADAA